MNWNDLSNMEQLDTIDEESAEGKVLLFKHSTRCSISATVLNRMERNWQESDSDKIKPYYLDLIRHRGISQAISAHYGIVHESPQVLIIYKRNCIYHASHLNISYTELIAHQS